MKRPVRQRGVILIMVLVLVALAAVVATALFFETGMSARRSASVFAMEQALQIGKGAEALAAYALSQDRNDTDTPAEDWAQPYGPVEVDEGAAISLEALVTDQQGRFNINSLVKADGTRDEDAYKVFVRLLELSQLEPRWADFVVDWIDPDTQPAPQGGEDGLYLSQQPPYRAANLPITSTSELMQIPGFTRDLYLQLAPHITALPASVRTINVCMADGIVLDALFALSANDPTHEEYSRMDPNDLADRRKGDCFPRRAALAANEPAMQAVTVERSSWFRLQTWVRIGTAQFALYSLMSREGGRVRPITRSFGTE